MKCRVHRKLRKILRFDIFFGSLTTVLGILYIASTINIAVCLSHTSAVEKYIRTPLENSQIVDFTDKKILYTKLKAVFGNTEYNLSDAVIKNHSRIFLICTFGNADIKLPENINVKMNTFGIFGSICDNRTIQSKSGNNAILNIDAFCLFGGGNIK